MTLVEGFGDEVIISLVLLALLTLLVLAWMSTGVRDRPLISIIIVDSQNFQRILQRISSITLRPINIHRLRSGRSHEAGEATQPLAVESPSTEQQNVTSSEASVNEGGDNEVSPAESDSQNKNTGSEEATTSVDSSVSENQDSPSQSTENPQTGISAETSGNVSTSADTLSSANVDNLNLQEDEEGQIRIRLKYLDDRQRLVHAKPEETVGDFKRKHFARELAENSMVRFIYNGQELRQDGSTLQAYNVADNSVIHCLLSSRPTQPHTPRQHSLIPEDWDAGFLMFPLFGLILALTWYFRITYRTYFNAMSTFSLLGITFLYIIALLASLHNHDEEEIVE